MLEDLRAYQKEALDQPDHDMQKHLDLLDKKDLKTTGWLTTPLDNVDHDFVSPLLNNYLKDIEKRMAVHDKAESGMAANLRKATKITDSEELVNIQYQKVASLKEQADQKEHELELERIKNEHNKKVKRLVRNKIDFKKNKGFRRQNSLGLSLGHTEITVIILTYNGEQAKLPFFQFMMQNEVTLREQK